MYETADKESSGDMMKGLQDLLTSQSDRAEKTSKSFVKEQKKTFSMMDSLLYHMEKPREIPQHGDIGNKKPSGTHVASIQDDAYDNLLLRMRVSVFKLSMVNAYDDIVEPLSLNMRINTLDVMDLMTRHQTENSMYYNAMVTGIGELKSDGEEKGRSVYLAMTSFFRNPAWTALHGATAAMMSIGKFVGSSAWKIAFGLGDKSSVEEKILMAIRDQTEFQRTGEIAKKTGFGANLKKSGIIGASARAIGGGVLNTVGIGSKNAQKVEDKNARGEKTGFWDKRALAFFDKSINKKAGIESTTGSTVNRNRNDSDGKSKTVELLEDIKQELFLIHNGQREGLIIDGEVIKQNKNGINQAKKFNKSIVNIEDDSEKSAKFDKWSYKVLKKIKNQAMIRGIIGFFGRIIGAITSLPGLIGGLALGIGAVVATKVKAIGSFISKGIKTAWDSTKKVAGKAWESTKKVGSKVLDKGKSLAKGAWESTKKVGSKLITKGKSIGGSIVKMAEKGASKIMAKSSKIVASIMKHSTGLIKLAKKILSSKVGLKIASKKLPIIGALAGLTFAVSRLMDGDFKGAGMEVASGAASMVPGPGTAASLAIDAAIFKRDMDKESDSVVKPDFDNRVRKDEDRPTSPTTIIPPNRPSNTPGASIEIEPASISELKAIRSALDKLVEINKAKPQTQDASHYGPGHDDGTMMNIYGGN